MSSPRYVMNAAQCLPAMKPTTRYGASLPPSRYENYAITDDGGKSRPADDARIQESSVIVRRRRPLSPLHGNRANSKLTP